MQIRLVILSLLIGVAVGVAVVLLLFETNKEEVAHHVVFEEAANNTQQKARPLTPPVTLEEVATEGTGTIRVNLEKIWGTSQ